MDADFFHILLNSWHCMLLTSGLSAVLCQPRVFFSEAQLFQTSSGILNYFDNGVMQNSHCADS
jgi:hypothetical protein